MATSLPVVYTADGYGTLYFANGNGGIGDSIYNGTSLSYDMDISYDITLAPVPDDGYKLESLILYGGNNNIKLKTFTSNYTFNLTSWPS